MVEIVSGWFILDNLGISGISCRIWNLAKTRNNTRIESLGALLKGKNRMRKFDFSRMSGELQAFFAYLLWYQELHTVGT